jgi:predicted metalloprotease with PDZ domain
MLKNQVVVVVKGKVLSLFFVLSLLYSVNNTVSAQENKPILNYSVFASDPSLHIYHIELYCSGWITDTVNFRMPKWMPGYYQVMDYAKDVQNFSSTDKAGKKFMVKTPQNDTWQIVTKKAPFWLSYDVKADQKSVASNLLDSTHGYFLPVASLMYIDGQLNTQVTVNVVDNGRWNNMASGLDRMKGVAHQYYAHDFNQLYDSPILIANYEELLPFMVNGIEHRFANYSPGNFDRSIFTANLQKVVQTTVNLFGEVPYMEFTFIGIHAGQGSVMHQNNAVISFDGNNMDTPEKMKGSMCFFAQEYFQQFNGIRIRPFELGPFSYNMENRTNLLWVTKGLSSYYGNLIMKRAGLITEQEILSAFEKSIYMLENNPGRFNQSLIQSSYNTWNSTQSETPGNPVFCKEKGEVVGLVLDLAIRNATQNKKSLDDVMRLLYNQYYKNQKRGFTDAEFQQTCETIAGIPLDKEFGYVYSTKEIDYSSCFNDAGLTFKMETNPGNGSRTFTIAKVAKPTKAQKAFMLSWLGK